MFTLKIYTTLSKCKIIDIAILPKNHHTLRLNLIVFVDSFFREKSISLMLNIFSSIKPAFTLLLELEILFKFKHLVYSGNTFLSRNNDRNIRRGICSWSNYNFSKLHQIFHKVLFFDAGKKYNSTTWHHKFVWNIKFLSYEPNYLKLIFYILLPDCITWLLTRLLFTILQDNLSLMFA